MRWCFSDVRRKELFSKHSNSRWSGKPWRSCDISGMEFCIIYKYLLYPFVPIQWRHNERDGFLNHRCLDCLLNRLFTHSSWIFLILKQLQNSVHESLIVGNSSLFKFMACNERTLNHSLNNTISHTQICHRASQCVTGYHDRNSLCNQNNRRYKQLSQSQPSGAVTVTVFFIQGNIDCLCRHGV